jgi:hypothetical protein
VHGKNNTCPNITYVQFKLLHWTAHADVLCITRTKGAFLVTTPTTCCVRLVCLCHACLSLS